MLTLTSPPTPEMRERAVLPPCLQPRAPKTIEIRDEHDRRVRATLAGYKLRRGKTYTMKVWAQEKDPSKWSLRLVMARSILEPEKDEIDGDARVLTFFVSKAERGDWKSFSSQVETVMVQLDFTNGREPFKFSLPIIVLASPWRWVSTFLLTALGSFGAEAIFHERVAVPRPSHMALFGGVWILFVLACVIWDQWKFYRQAKKLLGKITPGYETVPNR